VHLEQIVNSNCSLDTQSARPASFPILLVATRTLISPTPLPQIPIRICQPIHQHVSLALYPVLARQHIWNDAVLVVSICMGAMQKEAAAKWRGWICGMMQRVAGGDHRAAIATYVERHSIHLGHDDRGSRLRSIIRRIEQLFIRTPIYRKLLIHLESETSTIVHLANLDDESESTTTTRHTYVSALLHGLWR